jgi:transcriptional regulator GlxA family with amidase domain
MCFGAQIIQILNSRISVESVLMSVVDITFPERRQLIDYRLRAAMAYMRKNLNNPCLADDVAKLVGMSRSRFFDLYHDQIGTSPHVHWNAMRIEEACNRLRSNQENITSIALDLGFSNPGNFSRCFRDHTGFTPTSYRRVSHAA